MSCVLDSECGDEELEPCKAVHAVVTLAPVYATALHMQMPNDSRTQPQMHTDSR